MTGRVVALVLLVGLAVTACGGQVQEAPTADSATKASKTPSATPTAATEQQVASVIAGYQKDWRKVIKEAANCRWDYTMKDRGFTAQTKRMTCYMEEVTAGISAKNAIRDLDALTVPDSMQSLVSETQASLQAVADVNLEKVCGPVMHELKDTRKCDQALGTRYAAYGQLDDALDKWSPYL